MKRKRSWAPRGVFLLFALLFAGLMAGREIAPSNLSSADRLMLAELFRLKAEIGDRIFPGLAAADIPLILFNNQYDFLVGVVDPPLDWEIVEGGDLGGRSVFRRAHDQALQAFAMLLGRYWAGSMPTLGRMNSGRSPIKITPDFWIALAFHEMFHAFQAELASERFTSALAVYAHESNYPFQDKEFTAAWDAEGKSLYEAMKAPEEAGARRAAQEFLRIRGERRLRAGLAAEHRAFERELEWLEGLAKYAEVLFYESAAAAGAAGKNETAINFKANFLIHQMDLSRLGRALGRQSGDLRFYLSGLAQARLLDRLDPGWKARIRLKDVRLEEMLSSAERSRQ